MKKKTLRNRIRDLEREKLEVQAEAFTYARRLAKQILIVAAKPMPEGCERLCTPVQSPFRPDMYWTAEITPPDKLRWLDPGGNPVEF